jgi:hypothetical protein
MNRHSWENRYRRIEECFNRTSNLANRWCTKPCCRKRLEEDAAAGLASTTGWWMKDLLQTTGFRYKANGLVDAPGDVQVVDNASARAEHSGAVAWREMEVEQAESRHRGLDGKDYYAEPGSKMATTERHEPGLQVDTGRRWESRRRKWGRDSDVLIEQQTGEPKSWGEGWKRARQQAGQMLLGSTR